MQKKNPRWMLKAVIQYLKTKTKIMKIILVMVMEMVQTVMIKTKISDLV